MSAKKRVKAKKKETRQEDIQDKSVIAMRVTVVIVVVLLALAYFLNSPFIVRMATAVEVEGVKYTVLDYNYVFQNCYNTYYSTVQSVQGSSALLPEASRPLKAQYYDEEIGMTWSDYFQQMAVNKMKEESRIYKKAMEEGFTLSEEAREKMEKELQDLINAVTPYAYKTFGQYLRAVYGAGMTEKIFRKNLERSYIIDEYKKAYENSLVYPQAELDAYYDENQDMLDYYRYRYFLVRAEDVDENEYVGDTEGLEKAKEEKLEEARIKAEAYAARIQSEEDFINIAREYDSEQYANDDSTLRFYKGELLGSAYGPWLREAGRQYGDVGTAKIVSGYYVVFFIERNDNRYVTHNIRYMVFAPNTVSNTGGTAEELAEQQETNRKEAEQAANDAYSAWTAAGGTEEALIQQAELYEGVTNVTVGSGVLENVHLTQLPEVCEKWIFDPSRKPGDYTKLYDPEVGHYLLYYKGQGRIYRDVLAEEGLRERDVKTWKEDMTAQNAKVTWFVRLGK